MQIANQVQRQLLQSELPTFNRSETCRNNHNSPRINPHLRATCESPFRPRRHGAALHVVRLEISRQKRRTKNNEFIAVTDVNVSVLFHVKHLYIIEFDSSPTEFSLHQDFRNINPARR